MSTADTTSDSIVTAHINGASDSIVIPHINGASDSIVITHIHPVGAYKFIGVGGDICSICRNDLTSLCGECSIETDCETVCRITKGLCSHMMHEHCINAFQRATHNYTCVVCRANWVLTEVIDINNITEVAG